MESKNYSTIIISSILAFALIIAAATTAIPTISFKNVLAQGENITGMSPDQTIGADQSTTFNPQEIIKKEARGLRDADFGEVQQVTGEFIITQKGTGDKDIFYIPKNLVDHFDGSTVFFTVIEEEAKQYKRD
jgi:hypothetical protein